MTLEVRIKELPEAWTEVPGRIREAMKGLDIVVEPEKVDETQGPGFWAGLFQEETMMVHKSAVIAALHAIGKTLVARYWEDSYDGTLLAFRKCTYELRRTT